MSQDDQNDSGPPSHGPTPAETPLIDPRRKWLGPLFTASIILNVFLVGFVAARLMTPDAPDANPQVARLTLSSLPQGLSEEAREELEREFRAREDEMNEAYTQLQKSRARVDEIMSSDFIDSRELEQELAKLRRFQMQIQRPLHRAVVQASRDMNREARRAMMRDQRAEQRLLRLRRPGNVDGTTWRFHVEDGKVKLDLDIEGLEGLENLEQLKQLENFEIIFDDPDDDDEWWRDDDEPEVEEVEDVEEVKPTPPSEPTQFKR